MGALLQCANDTVSFKAYTLNTRPCPIVLACPHTRVHLQNDVEGSVQDFDAAMAMQPQMRPYLWQRGLSLYYLGDFKEAAQQFR